MKNCWFRFFEKKKNRIKELLVLVFMKELAMKWWFLLLVFSSHPLPKSMYLSIGFLN
jgi:hypothetical protein